MHQADFVNRMKDRLAEEQERINEELGSFAAHTEMGDEADENASEVELDEVNQDIASSLKADLAKIEKALAKIEDGTYGITEDGKEIPQERLEVMPWADSVI